MHQLKLTCRLIDILRLVMCDAVIGTGLRCRWIHLSVNDFWITCCCCWRWNNFSRYFSILKSTFTNNILHLEISFTVLTTFSLFLPTIFSLVGIILLTPRFCTSTIISTVSLSVFWVTFIRSIQFIRQILVQQQTILKDCFGCCRFV